MDKAVPAIEVPVLIDALVDAIAGTEMQARLDVQIAIFNHTMTAIVDTSRAAQEHAQVPRRVMTALVGFMGEALAEDLKSQV
jgi:hypothetical protein